MKITLVLALCAVIALADQQLSINGSQFDAAYKPGNKHTLTVLLHNNNPFDADGSGSVSAVHWSQNVTVTKYPNGVSADQAAVVTTLGPHNQYAYIGAISAQSNGFGYFTFQAQSEGTYQIYLSFTFNDGKGRVKVADQKLSVIVSASGSARTEEAAFETDEVVEASDAQIEEVFGSGYKRQTDGTVTCSQCSFGAVVGDNTYNTYGYTVTTAHGILGCTYNMAVPGVGVAGNSSSGSAPAGGSGAYNFVLRATSGPSSPSFTLTHKYRIQGGGATVYTFTVSGQVSVSCPGGGGSCSTGRSVAERARTIGQAVQEVPLAVRVGAAATALVAVVAAVVAVVIVRRNKNVTPAPIAEL